MKLLWNGTRMWKMDEIDTRKEKVEKRVLEEVKRKERKRKKEKKMNKK